MPAIDETYRNTKHLHRWFAAMAVLLLLTTLWLIGRDHRREWKSYQRTADQIEQRANSWNELGSDANLGRRPGQSLESPLIEALNSPLQIENLSCEGLTQDYYLRDVQRFDRCTTCHHLIDKHAPEALGRAAFGTAIELDLAFSLDNTSDAEPTAAVDDEALIEQRFGIRLASLGLIGDSHVTVHSVRSDSAATRASAPAEPVTAMTKDGVLADVWKVMPHRSNNRGVQVGDQLLEIDGQPVSNRKSAIHQLTKCLKEVANPVGTDPNETRTATLTIRLRRGLPQPYANHPRPELFVDVNSSHPMHKFACTICHEGQGSATEFRWAGHTPNSELQRATWRRELHWGNDLDWPRPMLPLRFLESSCTKCHRDLERIGSTQQFPEAPAPKLARGYELVRQFGCYGCHELNGFAAEAVVGPSLRHVASKLSRDVLQNWIRQPSELRPSTRMPSVFGQWAHLPMAEHAATKAEEQSEIEAIAAYLLDRSEPLAPLPSTESTESTTDEQVATEQRQRGQWLFQSQGCVACHNHSAFSTAAELREQDERLVHGPDLSDLQQKLTTAAGRQWLTQWIRRPSGISPTTRMPDFDLQSFALSGEVEQTQVTADAVADIVAFLLSEPSGDIAEEDASLTDSSSELVARGKAAISKYGCFGCHDIPGFEQVKRIGVELTNWGNKSPAELAFEQVEVYLTSAVDGAKPLIHPSEFYLRQLRQGSRIGFLHQKLVEPRSFDYALVDTKSYDQRLKMPRFDLKEDEREAIMTFILSQTTRQPHPDYLFIADVREQAIHDGRKVLDKYNCRGCHILQPERWTIEFSPGTFAAQRSTPQFPDSIHRFPEDELTLSAAPNEDGNCIAVLSGAPMLDNDGLPLVFDDYGDPLFDDESYDPYELEYAFQLWEPVALDGYAYQVGGSALPILGSMIREKRQADGGFLVKYLLPSVVQLEKRENPSVRGAQAWAWLPPPLMHEGSRAQPNWLFEYLHGPKVIRPAVLQRMPKYNLSEDEIRKLVEYFCATANTDYPFHQDPRRESDYLAAAEQQYNAYLLARNPEDIENRLPRLKAAERIVYDKNYCVTCHIVGEFDPETSDRAKAPNLAEVHRRLRSDYVHRWIANPAALQPYTPMPVNIPYDPEREHMGGISQQLFPGNSVEQLEALVDLLMNWDRRP